MNFAQPLSDDTLVRAAVRVVLPWSMWPMVPTLTCGLLRSNFSLAMSAILAYVRVISRCPGSNWRPRPYQGRALPTELHRHNSQSSVSVLERETGIEPATNSLEGCDSTTELLPPWFPFRVYFLRVVRLRASRSGETTFTYRWLAWPKLARDSGERRMVAREG